MARDSTTCCRRKEVVKKPVVAYSSKKRSASPVKGPPAKKAPERVFRASTLLGGGTSAPSLASKSQPNRATSSLVCAPDILSMFSDDPPEVPSVPPTPRITISTQPTQRQLRQVTPSTVPPLAIRQYVGGQPGVRPQIRPSYQQQASNIPMVQISTSQGTRPVSYQRQTQAAAGAPVYHNINGYRIDLNTAAQQETFRLPNGKLIQVKKQAPQQQVVNAVRQPQQFAQRNVVGQAANNSTPYTIRYQPPPVQIQQQQPRIINGGPTPQIQLQQAYQPLQPMQQVRPGVPGLPLKPPPCTLQKPCHPPTPLGIARNAFEFKVFNSLEVCHQIIGKINTLSNYPSYKTVNHVSELKDLYTHLSYLLSYAMSRFKSVQDKCAEESKALGLDEEIEKSKDKADDELEVIENQAPIIDLDSEGEEEGQLPTQVPPKAPSSMEVRPSTSSAAPKVVSTSDLRASSSIASIIEELGDPKLKMNARVDVMRAEALIPSVKQLLKKERKDSEPTEVQLVPESDSDDDPIANLLEVTPDISVMMGEDNDDGQANVESDDESVIELTDSPVPLVPTVSLGSEPDTAAKDQEPSEVVALSSGGSASTVSVSVVNDQEMEEGEVAVVPDENEQEKAVSDKGEDDVITISSQVSQDPLKTSFSSQETEKTVEKESEAVTGVTETESHDVASDEKETESSEEPRDVQKDEGEAAPTVETSEVSEAKDDEESIKGKNSTQDPFRPQVQGLGLV